MEVIGKIKMISETFDVGTSGFQKRELVVTSEEQCPQHIMLEFTQDKCNLLNGYQVGESVKVAINLRGREWVNLQGETKYFNSIQGWRIERLQAATPQPAYAPETKPFEPNTDFKEEEHDDVPF